MEDYKLPCYHPLRAVKHSDGSVEVLKFNSNQYSNLQLPCGQCIGCRLERSRQWAVRCVHEASLFEENCFITLTYNDENLPHDLSLVKTHFQLFMKRLRKSLGVKRINPDTGKKKTYYDKKIRFFHSGEYGEATPENDFIARPHYHALIFNHQFPDLEHFSEREGIHLYTSATLDRLWGKGFCSVGELTFESAAYVARYILKKITGSQADDYYTTTDHTTGEIITLTPEYSTMSRGGRTGKGIGYEWFKKFQADVYPSDHLAIRGVSQKPPRYYDALLELDDPDSLEFIKLARIQNAKAHAKDNTPERLAVREQVKIAQTTQLKRKLK